MLLQSGGMPSIPNPITSPHSAENPINSCPLPPASQHDISPPYSYNIPPEEKKPNNVPTTNRNDFKPNNTVISTKIFLHLHIINNTSLEFSNGVFYRIMW